MKTVSAWFTLCRKVTRFVLATGFAAAVLGMAFAAKAAPTLYAQAKLSGTGDALAPIQQFTVPANGKLSLDAASQLGVSADYKFSVWVVDSTNCTFLVGTSNKASVVLQCPTNDDAFISLSAYFVDARPTLTMVVNPSGAGTTVPPEGANVFSLGTNVSVSAAAVGTYAFVGWSNALNTTVNPTTLTMDKSKTLVALFRKSWTVTALDDGGPVTHGSFITNIPDGTLNVVIPVSASTPLLVPPGLIPAGSGTRFRCNGYANGINFAPSSVIGASTLSWTSSKLVNDVTWTWQWVPQFYITVNNPANGGVIITETNIPGDNDSADHWVDSNSTVVITMVSSNPAVWEPDFCLVGGNTLYPDLNGNLTTPPVVGPISVQPHFRPITQPLLPGWFTKQWGLQAGTPGSGITDDPDNDGLNNSQEAMLSSTNKGWYYNPLNADTDGDGMDDGYEYKSIDFAGTNLSADALANYQPAATDNGSGSVDKGPNGNPDGDYHWNTNDGYQNKARPLTNMEEYKGPDAQGPTYIRLTSGMPGYPLTGNINSPVVTALVANASDTGDQSKANTIDSDKDTMDDGFEHSWDLWHQTNAGYKEVILIGVTNGIPIYYTNTVRAWDGVTNGTRVFNPKTVYTNDGGPDMDILYDYQTAKVSQHYFDAVREYNVWQPNALSAGIVGAPHSILMTDPPDAAPQRSSHPFMWDVDRDMLPDGYEVIFGYDPWTPITPGHVLPDGQDNPDDDWMARVTTNKFSLRNNEVYANTNYNFDPRTAWAEFYPVPAAMPGPGTARAPNTQRYSNLDELFGPDGVMMIVPAVALGAADDATHPFKADTDSDGIWDGWENYVGLNPNDATDAGLDKPYDNDKLSNLAEFQSFVTSSTNRNALVPMTNWMNKIFPTDPRNADTDGDKIGDQGESLLFNGTSANATNVVLMTDPITGVVSTQLQVFTVATWNGHAYTGGGLNPTSSDTDQDTMPDPFEACYPGANSVDGTLGDTFADPDKDKLPNYLEYYSASVYQWQWDMWSGHTNPTYNSGDFYTATPKAWDWSQLNYIPLKGKLGLYGYSAANPNLVDTDLDGMDDYYEIYHGLNPIYGVVNILWSRILGLQDTIGTQLTFDQLVGDPRTMPYVVGSPFMDPDGDGLPNSEEGVYLASPVQSPQYHTCPSPLWMKDYEYSGSYVNKFYQPGSFWPWSGPLPPPLYAYDFEQAEGFDTDSDAFSDREELVSTQTDPLSPEHPVKRRALYLPPGQSAYARTCYSTTYLTETFRSFTVEAWVRPINPASGTDQVVVERPMVVPIGNPMNLAAGIRLNFRIGVDPAGLPYVAYHGEGRESVFYQAKAPAAARLSSNDWTHLCGTYKVASPTDPNQRGALTLYVNGQMAAQTNPDELPAHARFGDGTLVFKYGAPIMVGAADLNPSGDMDVGTLTPSPVPANFFKGWIDEVRIWDGARSQSEVASGMMKRMKQADVIASTTTAVPMLYLYTFDALPDPKHSATAPAGLGFDVTGNAIFPSDWTGVGFWATEPSRSMVYAGSGGGDPRFVPWIWNTAAHVPVVPPTDIGDPAVTNGLYRNTTNPYANWHKTAPARPTETFPTANDLLPSGYAAADEDIAMWDGGGMPSTQPFSSAGDGISDAWREAHGMDPLNPAGAGAANADPDGDGLNNFYEFLCGTDPKGVISTAGGIPDGDKDADGDGLSNIRELQLGTMPNMKDTDDDGLTDWEEVNGAVDPNWNPVRPAATPLPANTTDPLNPLSPPIPRSVYLNGNARLIVPPSDKLMSRDWTAEMWVKPELVTNNVGGVLVSRFVQGLTMADYAINYEVGLETNSTLAPQWVVTTNANNAVVTNLTGGTLRPYVRYLVSSGGIPIETRVDGLAVTEHPIRTVPIPLGVWTHVAGLYNSASNILAVYVNGKLASYRTDGENLPPLVYGYVSSHRDDEVTIGASRSTGAVANGYRGWLDEVRIWAGARTDDQILNNYNGPVATTGGQTTAGKQYVELTSTEQAKADAILSQARSLAAASGNKYTVGYSPVVLRPLNQLCGMKVSTTPVDPAHIAPASAVPVGLPSSFNWVTQKGVTPVKDQAQCGSCWAFATVGCFESALKIATGQDYDLSEQYLITCNLDGYNCNGGNSMHKYHYNTPAADGKFGAVLEADDPYLATDTGGCGGPYSRPFVLKNWAYVGNGENDLSIPDAKIKQAIFEHGPVYAGVYVGPAFQAYVSGVFNTNEQGPSGHGNHAILLVGWDDAGGYWIMKNQWGIGWGEAGYMRIAYGTSGIGEGVSYVEYGATGPAVTGNLAEFRFDDGGTTAQDFQVPKDWLNNWSSAAWFDSTNAWFVTNSVDTAPLDKDTDNDGLPDWWEMAFGLNPNDATDINGGNGDPDGDGLCNVAEYRAGTDPMRFDTRKSGSSDFYAWDQARTNLTNRYRIYGEMYTDHDGMDDWWEQTHGLDPRLYDAQLDPDVDGWSNLAEFQDGTDPQNPTNYPVPLVTFNVQYAGLSSAGNLIINAYSAPSMDGRPDAVFDLTALPFVQVNAEPQLPGLTGNLMFGNVVPGSLTMTVAGVGAGTFVDDGKGNLVGSVAGNSGTIDYVTGGWTLKMAVAPVTTTATYRYRKAATVYPMSLTYAGAKTGYLKEGNAWFFAFIDRNGNGTWDLGEPAGVAQYQPIDVRRGAFSVNIGLTDKLPGYQRFAWAGQPNQTSYQVDIRDESAGTTLRTIMIRAPRTWLHEQDYRMAGLIGLPSGSLSLQVFTGDRATLLATNYFDTLYYPSSPSVPVCQNPVGGPLHYALNEFIWTMDPNATQFRLQIMRDSMANAPLLDVTDVPTFADVNGFTHYRLPKYVGDGAFTNGALYYWRVMSVNPLANSSYSAPASFSVDLTDNAQGPWSIQGDIVYPGKVTNSQFIVQAYTSAGFGGVPLAQTTVKNAVTTNAWPLNRIHYALQGLPRGTYYVRAFLDQNTNGTHDVWETTGFFPSGTIYMPGSVDVPSSAVLKDVDTMFADTDNDKLPDDWEYQYYTNLTTAGPGPINGYTGIPWLNPNKTGTSHNVFDFYASSPLDFSPTDANAIGADGLPLRLKDALGLDIYSLYAPRISGMGTSVDGRAQVVWQALSGDGVTAMGGTGSTATVAGSGMTLHYQLQCTDDLMTWRDVPAQGSVSYDAVSRLLSFTDAAAPSTRHYYRYRIWWE